MRLARARRVEAVLPTVSTAGLALLSILFFLLTTAREVDRTRVDLPESRTRSEANRSAAVVVLVRDEDTGELSYRFSDGRGMTHVVGGPEDVYLEASRLIYQDATRQFILKADGQVPYRKVDELLDRMRRGGVQSLLLQTRQRTAPRGAP